MYEKPRAKSCRIQKRHIIRKLAKSNKMKEKKRYPNCKRRKRANHPSRLHEFIYRKTHILYQKNPLELINKCINAAEYKIKTSK
jgi:hypothetical protein